MAENSRSTDIAPRVWRQGFATRSRHNLHKELQQRETARPSTARLVLVQGDGALPHFPLRAQSHSIVLQGT